MSRLGQPLALAAVLAALGVPAVAGTPAASADLCTNAPTETQATLQDSAGHVWRIDSAGSLNDGAAPLVYATWLLARVNGVTYTSAGKTTCALEPGGRQLDLPEADLAGLQVSRKVFVPATGTAFERSITFLRNPTDAPITVTLVFDGTLDSSDRTRILATSSGDATVADPANDSWVVSADSATSPQAPPLAHVFDSVAPGVADHVDHIYAFPVDGGGSVTPWMDGEFIVRAQYDNVTVPAGAIVSYMEVEAQRTTIADAKLAAPALAAQPGEIFAGLTDAEAATLQNFNGADLDLDGVAHPTDDCPRVADAGQADLDGDGIGDACDDDVDGDGSPNAAESARGPDPRPADSDGDGVADGADACPAVRGLGADGCARFDTPPDRAAPELVLRAPSKLGRRALLRKGIRVSVTSSEPSAVLLELLAGAKRARIARSYNLTLAGRSLPAAAGTRTVTLRPRRSLVGAARRFTLRLRVTARDAAGNRTVKTRAVRITR